MPASPSHSNASTAVDDVALRNQCTRWLNGHRPLRSMRAVSYTHLTLPTKRIV